MPERFMPDTDLRIQALGSLMQTDAVRVIPMLREIALSGDDADDARRALFMLAQSHRPEARATVVEMASSGPEPVRVAAVRALGARADDELIRLADRETDPAARAEILARLRLLGTPAAKAYLAARRR